MCRKDLYGKKIEQENLSELNTLVQEKLLKLVQRKITIY